jgi:hypothetical protein
MIRHCLEIYATLSGEQDDRGRTFILDAILLYLPQFYLKETSKTGCIKIYFVPDMLRPT